MSYVAPPLKRLFDDSKRKMRTLREIVISDETEILLNGQPIVTGREVRDLTAVLLDILGSVEVPNPMHTKQTDERQLQTGRKTIVKETLQTRYFLLAEEVAIEESVTAIWIDHIATEEKALFLVPTVTGEIGSEMMIERDSTGEEVIPEEALMSCRMVMRNLVGAGGDGLTVILKVQAAEEIPRFVVHLTTELITLYF
jgi:hypothetical protein